MLLMYTQLFILSVLICKPNVGLLQEDCMSIVKISSKGEIGNSKSEEDNSLSSGGILLPISERCRWVTFGGSSFIGRLFMPLSNLACFAILTCLVSRSNHRIFLVVLGIKPRSIPFCKLLKFFAEQRLRVVPKLYI